MSTTLPGRTRIPRHRLDGEHEDYCGRYPVEDLAAMQAVADAQHWSLAEVMRRAVKFFLAANMHMIHVHVENGADDE